MTNAIETNLLTKRFGERHAVDGVSLSVPRGCAYGFLGPNGAGKTTLIRMLLGLTRATSGEMTLLGHPVPDDRSDALTRVGAIVEEPRFHPHLSGRENLRVAAAVRGPEARARIPAALARVSLAERADEKVKGYSLGMRQRLGVARCLIADPELLILDEPTNGLDPAGVAELRSMLRGLVDERRTVFVSSHLLDEVERTCDAAAIIDRGRVIAEGPVGELGAGGREEVTIGCDEPGRALALLAGEEAVRDSRCTDDGVAVVLAGGADAAARVNARLVDAGISVWRLERARQSLEDRFLQVTSRMGVE